MKDTYNLLADAIEKLATRLAGVAGEAIVSWSEKEGLQRYFGSSLKGEAAIDWDNKAQRDQLLTQIVEDVLDVSRVVSGKIRLNIETVNLAKLLLKNYALPLNENVTFAAALSAYEFGEESGLDLEEARRRDLATVVS